MPDWAQIITDALDILKFDGAVQDTLAELRKKWSGHGISISTNRKTRGVLSCQTGHKS